MNELIKLNQDELTMSSREIAELTGKRHDNVMADCRKILNELNIDAPIFLGTYKTAQGKMKPIKITPEWLIKLGFTRNQEDGEFDHKDNENVIILCENDGYFFDYEADGEWCHCGVTYVHQLQSHFYRMTEQELTIGGEE